MNIALINRYHWEEGAVSIIQRSLAKRLSKKGIKVTVLASDVSEKDSGNNITFVKIFTRKVSHFDLTGFIFSFFLFFKLIHIHRKEKIDVLQVHDSTAFYGACLFSKIYHIPTIIFVPGWIYNPVRQLIYRKSVVFIYKLNAKFCAKNADVIWACSEEIVEGMKWLGAIPEKIKLCLNSIDLDEFPPGDIEPIRKKEKIVLSVGRLSREKGHHYLIEAIPIILKKIPQIKFNIIGDGNQKEYLLNFSRKLNIKNKVNFIGTVSHNNLFPYYSQADILVMPSLSEGHSLVPIESLACGTPVIATKIGGIIETVIDDYNGLLVEAKNSEAIALAVIKIFSDKDLLKRLSKNARSSIEKFSWENTIDKFLEICEELIKNRNG